LPGRPRQRAVHAELLRLAREKLGDGATTLDFAEAYCAEGGNLSQLARDLTASMGIGAVGRETVRLAVYQDEAEAGEAEARLKSARARGSHALIEESQDLADTALVNRDAIAKVKLQTDIRARMAKAYDRDTWGDSPSIALQINAGSLHLDALRRTQGSNNPLPARVASAQVAEAQDVSALPASIETEAEHG
jgi:hypothetical protein